MTEAENLGDQAMVDRRTLLAASFGGSALLTAAPAAAAPGAAVSAPETLKLWPAGPPGGAGLNLVQQIIPESEGGSGRVFTHVAEPLVDVYRAPTGGDTAVLVIPGGGFTSVWFDKEGVEISRWLNRNGISAGALLYRLPGDGWAAKEDAPMQDALRALRLLAKATGAKRLGVMGFSAGGTIAAALATRWDEIRYPAVDAADALEVRPAFMALGYPFLNRPPPPALATMFHGMTAKAPPAFFFLAADDKRVSIDNSTEAFKTLRGFGVPAALHVFESGGHGFGLRSPPGASTGLWPDLFLAWARGEGVLG